MGEIYSTLIRGVVRYDCGRGGCVWLIGKDEIH